MGDRVWPVPQNPFVAARNGTESLGEVVTRVKELAGGNVPRWAVMARATARRKDGVVLQPLGPAAGSVPKEPGRAQRRDRPGQVGRSPGRTGLAGNAARGSPASPGPSPVVAGCRSAPPPLVLAMLGAGRRTIRFQELR